MTTWYARLSILAVLAFLLPAENALAAESPEAMVAKARRELEVLKIQQRLFRKVEHPRQMRELDTAIRLTQAEVDALENRVRYYKRMADHRSNDTYWDSLQKAELALLEARLRRNNLMQERLAIRRSFSDRCRLLELKIAGVRARLAELERRRLGSQP